MAVGSQQQRDIRRGYVSNRAEKGMTLSLSVHILMSAQM